MHDRYSLSLSLSLSLSVCVCVTMERFEESPPPPSPRPSPIPPTPYLMLMIVVSAPCALSSACAGGKLGCMAAHCWGQTRSALPDLAPAAASLGAVTLPPTPTPYPLTPTPPFPASSPPFSYSLQARGGCNSNGTSARPHRQHVLKVLPLLAQYTHPHPPTHPPTHTHTHTQYIYYHRHTFSKCFLYWL